jgi:hypothetical protein
VLEVEFENEYVPHLRCWLWGDEKTRTLAALADFGYEKNDVARCTKNLRSRCGVTLAQAGMPVLLTGKSRDLSSIENFGFSSMRKAKGSERGRGVGNRCWGFEEEDGVAVDCEFCGVGDAAGGEDLAEGAVEVVHFVFREQA